MNHKEIDLLKEQIERLNQDKFELDAWKNRTLIFLERIFGKESPKLKMIQSLHYDYSSWSLRDTYASGSEKNIDPVRIQAKEILEAILAELEALGVPGEKKEQQKIRELIEDELTGKQLKELNALLTSDHENITESIAGILETLPKETLTAIIAKLLTV